MKINNPKLAWKRHFSIVIFVLISIMEILSWTFPDILDIKEVTKIAATIFAVKLIIEIPGIINQYLERKKGGETLSKQLILLFPKNLIGLFHLECAQQHGFLLWAQRKKVAKINLEGKVFHYHKKSQYPTVLIILLILCFTDMPVSMLMLSVALDDASTKIYMHVFLVIATLYTVTWIIADWHLVKATHYIAGETILHLQVGARFKAEIPWATVKDAASIFRNKELKESKNLWLKNKVFNPRKLFCALLLINPILH